MDPSIQSSANKPSALGSAWGGFKATVGSFFSGMSPTTWFGSKTTSFIGEFLRAGGTHGSMGHPCSGFVPVTPLPTEYEFGNSYHRDAEPMKAETAAASMRYAAAIGVTCGSPEQGINALNLAYAKDLVDKNQAEAAMASPSGTLDGVGINDDFSYTSYDGKNYSANNIDIRTTGIEGSLETTVDSGVNYHIDLKSGLAFTALKDSKTNEIVVSFPGLGGGASIPGIKGDPQRVEAFTNAQLSSVTKQIAGDVPLCYKQAAAVVAQIKKDNPDAVVTTAGFSFGGSVAQYAALKYESDNPSNTIPVKAHCFNGLAIGAGLQRSIGDTTLNKADAHVTHYGTQGDWVTDLKGMKILDKILGFIGFRTPGNYGKKYVLPPASESQSMGQRHINIFTNMLNKTGWIPKKDPAQP